MTIYKIYKKQLWKHGNSSLTNTLSNAYQNGIALFLFQDTIKFFSIIDSAQDTLFLHKDLDKFGTN